MNYFILQKPLAPFKRSLEVINKNGKLQNHGKDNSKSNEDDLVLRREKPLFRKESSLEQTMGLRTLQGH